MIPTVFSVGHSSHPPDVFVSLLKQHGITRLVDVRSSPSSRHNPQFCQDNLRSMVESAGIEYMHHKLLGGREKGGDVSFRLSNDPSVSKCLLSAIGRPELLLPSDAKSSSSSPSVASDDVARKTSKIFPALMCSEANWHDCHRQNLCHYLVTKHRLNVFHIWPDGKLEQHTVSSRVILTQKDSETAAHVAAAAAAASSSDPAGGIAANSVTVPSSLSGAQQQQQQQQQQQPSASSMGVINDNKGTTSGPSKARKNRNRLQ